MNYQEKVSTRQDVRALFQKVKNDPGVSHYRGYTDTKSYGWDEDTGDYVKREGEFWFENPAYKAGFDEVSDSVAEPCVPEDEMLDGCEEAEQECCAECEELRLKQAELEEALFAAESELDVVKEQKEALCAILCNLRAVLESVLAHKPE